MDNERVREICLALPHVAETLNWGCHPVYWAGDRALGGKMFALTTLEPGPNVLMFHCGAERYHELLENEGIIPAPHLARAHWVAMERWEALPDRQIREELTLAHHLTMAKLTRRTLALLALPEAERKRAIRERVKLQAAKAEAAKIKKL